MVTFGRKRLFDHKREIEERTGLRCGVIYGALPPGTRKEQARLFNQRQGGYVEDVCCNPAGYGTRRVMVPRASVVE